MNGAHPMTSATTTSSSAISRATAASRCHTLLTRTGDLIGTTIFAGPGNRHAPVDRNNVAPRLGFAYAMTPQTVIRGGAGIYYGLNVATNFQFVGTAFGNTTNMPVTV